MSFVNFIRGAGLIVWGVVLTGTLSVAHWSGDWGHSVCGAWGCGPPLQALVACHSSWLVVLLPIAVIVQKKVSAKTLRIWAAIALSLSLMSLLGVAAHEYLTWYARATEWQRPFYWWRVGFVVLTTVEVPLLQTLVLAVPLLCITSHRHRLHSAGALLIAVRRSHSPESDGSEEPSPVIP